MAMKMKNLIPEMEAINMEVESNIKKLQLKDSDESSGKSSGKAFESVCYNWICNKELREFGEDDTDGGQEFGIDSVSIEEKNDGSFFVRILSCKYSGGFSYQKVDEIEKGLTKIFDEDNYKEIKNEKLKEKIKEIRENKRKIKEVKIYYCVNSSISLKEDDECIKSRVKLLEKVKKIFRTKYDKKVDVDFLFFNAKSIYEKKMRNENPLSKEDDISIKYKKAINPFDPSKEIDFEGGKIEGCVITVEALELKRLLEKWNDWIFHYNIRKYKGKTAPVNKRIESTIKSESREKFWFLNNGITLVCEHAIENNGEIIKFRYPQVVNGQQTLKTVESFPDDKLSGIDILVRVCITNNEEVFSDIAFATNSQTRIDFSDMSSNKSEQHAIKSVFEKFGYYYKNKKGIEKRLSKIGVDSKMLGRISFATINKHPTLGRKTVRDSIIFSEDNYLKLFNVNPLWLLLSFLVYNFCKKNDPGIKNVKRIALEREIKHFGIFHMSALIWNYIENKEIILDKSKTIQLIKSNNFEEFYKKAYLQLENVIKKEKMKDKKIILKEFFSNEMLDNLIFKL